MKVIFLIVGFIFSSIFCFGQTEPSSSSKKESLFNHSLFFNHLIHCENSKCITVLNTPNHLFSNNFLTQGENLSADDTKSFKKIIHYDSLKTHVKENIKTRINSKSLNTEELENLNFDDKENYLKQIADSKNETSESFIKKDIQLKEASKEKIPVSEIEEGRSAVRKVKKINDKVIHVKDLDTSPITAFFKQNNKSDWYKRFKASLLITSVNSKLVNVEIGTGIRWDYNDRLSFGISYAIRTRGSISNDTLSIIREPLNTTNVYLNTAVFKNIFVQTGIQIVSKVAGSTNETIKDNTYIPYIMLGREFNISNHYKWHLGTRFNIIKNENIYANKISIQIGINRKLNTK